MSNGISGSVLGAGIDAFQAGKRRVEVAAAEIAGATASADPKTQEANSFAESNRDLVTSLVELQAGKLQAQAGAKVVETADEVLGTLLDIRT